MFATQPKLEFRPVTRIDDIERPPICESTSGTCKALAQETITTHPTNLLPLRIWRLCHDDGSRFAAILIKHHRDFTRAPFGRPDEAEVFISTDDFVLA